MRELYSRETAQHSIGGNVYKFWSLSVLALVAACAKGKADGASADTTATTPAAAATAASAPGAAPADTGMKGMHMDADKSAAGTGVPAGYTGVTDHADAKITDAKYTV